MRPEKSYETGHGKSRVKPCQNSFITLVFSTLCVFASFAFLVFETTVISRSSSDSDSELHEMKSIFEVTMKINMFAQMKVDKAKQRI